MAGEWGGAERRGGSDKGGHNRKEGTAGCQQSSGDHNGEERAGAREGAGIYVRNRWSQEEDPGTTWGDLFIPE